MQIDNLETFIAHNWMFVRISTDTGLQGVGESTFFGWPGAAREVAESFRDYLVGKDPLDVERLWLSLYRNKSMRGQSITGAISAIDQALWDIKGKRFDAPVWQLLGGKARDRVRAMLVLGEGTPEEVAEQAAQAKRDGYTAVKVLLFQHEHHGMRHGDRVGDLARRAELIREAIGWEIDMGIEIHRNMVPGESIVLCQELQRLRPLFVEDPIAPDSVLSFGEVAQKVRVPMAAGERNTTIWEFREYIEHGGIHHVRPDIGVAGGFTHVRKICAMAEAHHQGVIPHAVPSGPVATLAHVHMGIAAPNWEVQEHRPQEGPPWTDVVDRVAVLKNGMFEPPEAPGLGIELDEEGIRKHPPTNRAGGAPLREDGSVALR
ncbi:MAG: mandelate racemase/muconate lactonizing enzyme family protein [Chloroflexota bacterium]